MQLQELATTVETLVRAAAANVALPKIAADDECFQINVFLAPDYARLLIRASIDVIAGYLFDP